MNQINLTWRLLEVIVRANETFYATTTLKNTDIDALDFRDMIRVAADAELVAEPKRWFEYRKKRNITSHTYDKHKAEEVLSIVDDFLEDVRFLLAELKRRNAS